MSYITLGSRRLTGEADITGLNPGKWTVSFTPQIIDTNVQPQFEVYKIIVKGAQNTTFDVYINNDLWDTGIFGQSNSWDPTQPMILRPGDTVSFTYSNPATDGQPPTVTIWLRYEVG